MMHGRIDGAQKVLGAPADWNPERDGPCHGLAVRIEPLPSGSYQMVSAWHPTPDELLKLAAGAAVYLSVVGCSHPPVALTVGDPPR